MVSQIQFTENMLGFMEIASIYIIKSRTVINFFFETNLTLIVFIDTKIGKFFDQKCLAFA